MTKMPVTLVTKEAFIDHGVRGHSLISLLGILDVISEELDNFSVENHARKFEIPRNCARRRASYRIRTRVLLLLLFSFRKLNFNRFRTPVECATLKRNGLDL